MVSFYEVCVPRRVYFQVFAVALISGVEKTTAFSTYCPTVVPCVTDKINLLGNSLASLALEKNGCNRQQRLLALSAVHKGLNNKNQPDAEHDFIAIDEANKMLQQERLRNEREIRQMKIALKRQHQELLEFDGEVHNIQLFNDDDAETIDFDDENSEDAESNCPDDHDSPFSTPFSTDIDEEQFRQNQGRSHNNAERRTLEIALQQIAEDNQDLKNEFDDKRNHYESDIEETQRLIADIRDRFDCVQHELKLEYEYFERAKAELEEVLDQERSQARDLEQQLLLAKREQEILEQAAVEAQHRQEELEREELELRRQQEQLELEREEEEHKEQIQLEQEEHERQRQQEQMQLEREEQQRQQEHVQHQQEEEFRQEELLRNHQELADLDKYQKQFDDVYFSIYNSNGAKNNGNDYVDQNQIQMEQDASVVNGGQENHQYENSSDWVSSTQSTNSPEFSQYAGQPQQQYQQWESQQTFSVAVTTKKHDPQQPRKVHKRETRANSRSHGIFMNFNDILV